MSQTLTPLPDFDSLWDYSNLEKTGMAFDDLIPLAKESGDAEYFLQLLTQIARTQGLQSDFTEAHLTLDEVQEGITAETPTAKIRYFLERGRVFNSSKEVPNAKVMFARAYELAAEGKQDNLAIDAAHMLAIAESDSAKKMEWNHKALALAEKSQDLKTAGWLGSLYNNMAWAYHDSEKFEDALALFKKGQAFRESKSNASATRIAKWSVARALRSLKKYDEAFTIQSALKTEFDALGEKDPYVLEELGELSLSMEKTDEAKEFFRLAYNQFSKDDAFKKDHAPRFKRIHELSLKR